MGKQMTAHELLELKDAQIRFLQDQLFGSVDIDRLFRCKQQFGLTKTAARILLLLIDRGARNREAILAAVYGDYATMREEKNIDVQMVAIRKGLSRHGLSIETVWGEGYAMTDENRKAAANILTPAQEVA